MSAVVSDQIQETNRLHSLALDRPLRVVSIAHPAFLDGSARLRYAPLADRADLDLALVIPDKWSEEGRPATKGVERGPLKILSRKVRIYDLPKAKWYLHFYPEMGAYLRELAPDVIHLWEEPWSLVALQASILRDRLFPNAALILETDQNILRRLPQPFEWIRRHTLKKVDLLIARQQEALDVSKACGYVGPSQFVEYLVDDRVFCRQDAAACRREFGINSFCIGYVGRITREKGLFTILQALTQTHAPVSFICMGSGKDEQAFKTEVERLKLTDRVRLLPAAAPSKVARLMGGLDAFILMSETTSTWKEQFGRVIIEAQSCGVPVIGSDSGSIPHVTGQGGWIVQERDAAGLARLLDALAVNPQQRQSAAMKAVSNVRRFSSDIVSTSLAEAFIAAYSHRNRRS